MKKSLQILCMLVAVFLFAVWQYGMSDLHKIVPLLPPIVAIGLAFITKNVIFSLFCGVYVGALALIDSTGLMGLFKSSGLAILRVGDTYLLNAISDKDYAANILFILCIGGTIGVITQSGGFQGIIEKLAGFARSARRSQILTWLMGVGFFVDDYGNTVVVGSTMRPITDKLRVSREKLSFIIDATAAPVTSLALVSTWVAYEVSMIDKGLVAAGLPAKGYAQFIQSLPYSFYAIFLLVFVPSVILLRRDYGPMLKAERRARTTGDVLRPGSHPLIGKELDEIVVDPNKPKRWYNAITPIAVMILTIVIGIYLDGRASLGDKAEGAALWEIIGEANPFVSLMWGSITSGLTAIIMTVWQKLSTLEEAIDAWVNGVKSMVLAVVVLAFAWSLAGVMGADALNTRETIAALIGDGLNPKFLPMITFVVSWLVAFATGTSWGTMAIIFPLIVPLTQSLGVGSGMEAAAVATLLSAVCGSVLTGAICGDHSSPLSDTTIMSSMWSAVDHMDHVRTQMPYALTVGAVAIVFGYLPAGFGVNPWLLILLGSAVLIGILKFIGKDPEAQPEQETKEAA